MYIYIYINIGFIRRFKNATFDSYFATIYIIRKMLVLIRNNLNYLKDDNFECFFKEYNRLLFKNYNNFLHNI